MLQGDERCLRGLAGEHRPRRLDGERNGDRDPLLIRNGGLHPFDPEERSFHVAHVLAGLDQEIVRSSFEQPAGLHFVMRGELFERRPARDRDRLRRRTHRTGDESRSSRRRERVRHLPGQGSADPIQLPSVLRQGVFGEDERGGAEGIRLEDVGAGLEVASVDLADQVGTCPHQLLIATFVDRAAEIGCGEVVLLDGGPHRPVQHQDALDQCPAQRRDSLRPHVPPPRRRRRRARTYGLALRPG